MVQRLVPSLVVPGKSTTASQEEAIKVVISDASHMVCELLAGALKRARTFRVVSCAVTAQDVHDAVSGLSPDVALISAHLADGPYSGFNVLRQLRCTNSQTRFVMLVDSPDRDLVVDAFRGGVRGVFRRSSSLNLLCRCISAVHSGQVWASAHELDFLLDAVQSAMPLRCTNARGECLLTRREQEILPLVAEGLTNREISSRLQLSEHTVKNHLFRIYDKLGISSRVELILYAVSQRAA